MSKNNKKDTLKEKVEKVIGSKKEEETEEVEMKELTPEEKIQNLEVQIIELKNDKLRALADFDNYRKRKDQEIIDARDKSVANFVTDILPAIDNFEMSLKMTDNTEMFVKGVEMIHQNLISTLKDHKIEEFSPKVGDEFNPTMHDPNPVEDEKAKEGKVLAVIKKGFMHKDKIIRASRVNVKKGEE